MDDECSSLPRRRVSSNRASVMNGEGVPRCFAVWNGVDELKKMVVVVEDRRVIVAVDFILLAQNAEKGVDVVN